MGKKMESYDATPFIPVTLAEWWKLKQMNSHFYVNNKLSKLSQRGVITESKVEFLPLSSSDWGRRCCATIPWRTVNWECGAAVYFTLGTGSLHCACALQQHTHALVCHIIEATHAVRTTGRFDIQSLNRLLYYLNIGQFHQHCWPR